MRNNISFLLSIILLVSGVMLISSCFLAWQDVDRYTWAVWAEDDSGIAYYRMNYRERRGDVIGGFFPTEDHTFRVYTADTEGGNPVQIGPERAGTPGEIYYMKGAGYLLIDEYPVEGRDSRYTVLYLDGTDVVLVEDTRLPSTDLIWALPSPDGEFIAVMTPEIWCPDLNDYSSDCNGGEIYTSLDPDLKYRVGIEFYDSATLTRVDTEPRVILTDGVAEFAWLTEGVLMVAGNNSLFVVDEEHPVNSYTMDPTVTDPDAAGYIEQVSYPEDSCLYPPTTSSYISASGEAVYAEGRSFYFETDPMADVFGCE